MSFMFHPYPYIDHRAVNPVTVPDEVASDFTQGTISVARRLSKALEEGKRRIAIDGYTGVEFSALKQVFEQYLPSRTRWIDSESLLKEGAEVERMTACCLPTDRSIDPALLYGVRFSGTIEDLQDSQKMGELQRLLGREVQPVVVIGRGALSSPLRDLYDLRIWVDITPRTAALNFKYGRARNVGFDHEMPFNETMRRNYYVDFENAVNLRWKLIDTNAIDWYMTADDMQQVSCMTWAHVKELFDELRKKAPSGQARLSGRSMGRLLFHQIEEPSQGNAQLRMDFRYDSHGSIPRSRNRRPRIRGAVFHFCPRTEGKIARCKGVQAVRRLFPNPIQL